MLIVPGKDNKKVNEEWISRWTKQEDIMLINEMIGYI